MGVRETEFDADYSSALRTCFCNIAVLLCRYNKPFTTICKNFNSNYFFLFFAILKLFCTWNKKEIPAKNQLRLETPDGVRHILARYLFYSSILERFKAHDLSSSQARLVANRHHLSNLRQIILRLKWRRHRWFKRNHSKTRLYPKSGREFYLPQFDISFWWQRRRIRSHFINGGRSGPWLDQRFWRACRWSS